MNGVFSTLSFPQYDDAVNKRVIDYFAAHAPAQLMALPPEPRNTPVRFFPEFVADNRHMSITNVNAVDLNQDSRPELLVCESAGLGRPGGRLTWFDRPSDSER